MSDYDDSEEISTSTLFKDNPEWSDIDPIYNSPSEEVVVKIAVREQFTDAFAYFRAILQKKELSERAFNLTQECIQLNPANYTLWQYRRELLKGLKKDLQAELRYLDSIIIETPKNYQVWHHRRAIVEWIGEPGREIAFTAEVLEDEPKNYHAWQYRQWIIMQFNLASELELSFSLSLIMQDPRNNSAWNYRYYILQLLGKLTDKDQLDIEINTCKRLIENMPNNESIWNYLIGILFDGGLSARADVVEFVENLYAKTNAQERSPFLVSFICDYLLELISKCESVKESVERAHQLYEELIIIDPIRTNYWKYQQKYASNLQEKAAFRCAAK